jgi:hypothetical protein
MTRGLFMIKTMHRIWYGSDLPEKYKIYLLNFKMYNPAFIVKLWSDFDALNAEQLQKLKKWCSESTVELINIREHKNITNHDLITEELNGAKNEPHISRVHYVRASDISRTSILIEQGGIYCDTDTDTCCSLPDLKMPFGFCITIDALKYPFKNKKLDYTVLGYDFIAAEANNPILLLTAKITKSDYEIYHNLNDKKWLSSKSRQLFRFATIALTGSSLFHALQHYITTNAITEDKAEALFFHSGIFMPSYFDKSWLSQFDDSTHSDPATIQEEADSYRKFNDQLVKNRMAQFPFNSTHVLETVSFNYKSLNDNNDKKREHNEAETDCEFRPGFLNDSCKKRK